MTTSGSLRRIVVTTTLGSFSIAALLGVLALLGGGDFGEGQARVLGTTLLVGLTSVAVLCYLATSETAYQPVGVLGGFTVLVPLFAGLWLIWAGYPGGDSNAVWRSFTVGIVVAATLAQASLLLGLVGARRPLRPLLLASLAFAALLGVLVSVVILGGDVGGGLLRMIGIVAILDVLGTVVAIALGVLGRLSGPSTLSAGQSAGPSAGPLAPAVAAPDATAGTTSVVLPEPLAAELDLRSRATGRTRDDLAAEAVARYLTLSQSGM